MIHEEEKPSFKVVDKRAFMDESEDNGGGCCGGHDHHHDEEMNADNAHHHGDSDEKMLERPEMSFSLFMQTLAHQAMMGLGIVEWPDSGLIKIELGLAKETIDILAMLKEKTKNNLTSEEQLMVDSILYQLQVAYVEIAKSPEGVSPLVK